MSQEIYVKEMPKCPDDCPCNYDTFCNVLCDGINCWSSKIREDCPLIDIKTHDRELVKEVCEKIRDMAHKVGKLEFCEHCYAINPARAINEHLLNEKLGQIESEIEQKEYEK